MTLPLNSRLRTFWLPAFISENKEDKADDTHLGVKGATEVAKIAVEELKKTKLDIVKYIKS